MVETLTRKKTSKSSSKRVARSLHAHSVVGLALGALIYILAVTGTLSVFNHEFQRWEQPSAPEMTEISPDAAAKAAISVFESEETPTTHLYINFPQPDLPRTIITTDTQAFFAAPDGTIAGKERFPWTQFLLDLHYYLHLPQILGLTVVGALGAFLLAMSMSGFLAHPRIFRDAFTVRRGAGRVPLTDLHNRLSVWTAPFHISNALTGALLGLASILAFAIAADSFGGDTGKVFDPIFGSEPAPSEAAAALSDIAGPLEYMSENFPDLLTTYYILHDPGTAGQHVNIIAEHSDRLIFGEYYNFDTAGNYTGNVGISDGTTSQQIVGAVYNVHFGNWGGLPVKLGYGVFGLALCFIVASGLRIYFVRRSEKGNPAPRLAAAWEGVIWGTPAMLTFTLLVSLLTSISKKGLAPVFWLGLIIVLIAAVRLASASQIRRMLKLVLAMLILFSTAVHLAQNTNALGTIALINVTLPMVLMSILLLVVSIRDFRKNASSNVA